MKSKPFFSVVIALYNKKDYIANTLKSVLNQTFTDYEIVIVNDGSTDNSFEIVNRIKDSRIISFNIKNQGAAYARNYGIQKANAEYIALLDADDLWKDIHLETIFNLLKDYPNTGMYCSGYNLLYGDKRIKKSKLKGIPNEFRGIISNYFESNLFNSIVNSSVVVISKHVLEDIGLFDIGMKSGQDTDLWTRIALKYKVAIHNITTTTVLKNDNSLSNTTHVKDRQIFLNKFILQEKTNIFLKKFMDMNRYSVALNFKMNNQVATGNSIYKDIDSKNISFKQKLIYNLPINLLQIAYRFKKILDKKGIFFHLYR